MKWVPPWTRGLPQERCRGCGTNVVARTLSVAGECADCVGRPRRTLPPVPHAPSDPTLFDDLEAAS